MGACQAGQPGVCGSWCPPPAAARRSQGGICMAAMAGGRKKRGKKKVQTGTHRRMVSGLATAMAASNLPDSALTIDIAGAQGIRDWASLVVEWWWGGGGVGGEGRDKLTELLTHSTYCITIRQPTRGEGQRASTVQIDPPSPFTCSTGLPQGCQATVTAVIKIGRLHNPLTQWSLNFY